ncbi:hypothetical protein PEX1_051910 [Penicillium expansum]|uniref:Uncharacterized protein n=1 Tax=Penicillium expansum TaxID=27334 RepID=A0A0A2J7T2_PENEN|nr:hypothetical protein PEX2_010440 [Penicillium expansum]KGO51477.1 hypothetical protein PEX2_010440 [Penicillium expansum]KGO66287.1 hypothetical protein PEX1_051910 [Penicillium expansum]
MSFLQIRPAFKFSTNIFGQLEAAGTTYFDGFIAVPGNRAHIESMPGFVPTVVATAIDVDSRYVEIVLGERSHLDATIQLTGPFYLYTLTQGEPSYVGEGALQGWLWADNQYEISELPRWSEESDF